MGFSLAYQKLCNRGKRMVAFAQETVLSLTEPFVLRALYPLQKYKREDGTDGWKHKILPHQRKVHDAVSFTGKPAKFILFNGGVGVGKTLCICAEMLRLLKTYPGIKIVCTAPFDFFFVETILPKWNEVLDDDDPFVAYKNVKDRLYRMINGSEIRFHSYDDPERVRGWEAHIIWIEEAAQMCHSNNALARELFNRFVDRLRAKPDSYPKRIYLTQNPSGHNWVWSLFIKPEPGSPQPYGDDGKTTNWGGYTSDGYPIEYSEWEKVSKGDVYYTVSAPTVANKTLDASYINSMLGTNASAKGTIDRMILGKFTPMMSMVYEYPMWSVDTHCIDMNAYMGYWDYDVICPPWLRVAVGIDCGGQVSPWAIEFYLQTEDMPDRVPQHWICFDEIYTIKQTWQEIIQLIKDKLVSHGLSIANVEFWIDPISSNHRNGPTSITIKQEFANHGIPTNYPKGYNKFGAIARVHDYMRRDHAMPCPYKMDEREVGEDGGVYYPNGHAGLYYLSGVPERKLERNERGDLINTAGHACPANIAEKGVYRYDNTKQREPNQSEEGLKAEQPQKIMDREDHAQTAEMFWVLGVNPFPPRDHGGHKRGRNPVDNPPSTYGRFRRGRN